MYISVYLSIYIYLSACLYVSINYKVLNSPEELAGGGGVGVGLLDLEVLASKQIIYII